MTGGGTKSRRRMSAQLATAVAAAITAAMSRMSFSPVTKPAWVAWAASLAAEADSPAGGLSLPAEADALAAMRLACEASGVCRSWPATVLVDRPRSVETSAAG